MRARLRLHPTPPLETVQSAYNWRLELRVQGSLCEYIGHECAKSSLAFRKLAVAAASRRPDTG